MAFTKHCWTERTPLLSMLQLCLLPSTLTLALEDLVFHEMLQCNNLCILRISSTGITAISPFSKNLFEMILSILPGLVNHQKCNFRHSQSSWTCTIWHENAHLLANHSSGLLWLADWFSCPKCICSGTLTVVLIFASSWVIVDLGIYITLFLLLYDFEI